MKKNKKKGRTRENKRQRVIISQRTRELLALAREYAKKKWEIVDRGYFIKHRNAVVVRKGATYFKHPSLIPYQEKFSTLDRQDYIALSHLAIHDTSTRNHYLALHILQFCPDKEITVRTLLRTARDNDYEINRISTMFLQTFCRVYPIDEMLIAALIHSSRIKSINDGLLIAFRCPHKNLLKELSKRQNCERLAELSGWKCFYISRYASALLKKIQGRKQCLSPYFFLSHPN